MFLNYISFKVSKKKKKRQYLQCNFLSATRVRSSFSCYFDNDVRSIRFIFVFFYGLYVKNALCPRFTWCLSHTHWNHKENDDSFCYFSYSLLIGDINEQHCRNNRSTITKAKCREWEKKMVKKRRSLNIYGWLNIWFIWSDTRKTNVFVRRIAIVAKWEDYLTLAKQTM